MIKIGGSDPKKKYITTRSILGNFCVECFESMRSQACRGVPTND